MNTAGFSMADGLARARSLGAGLVLATQHWGALSKDLQSAVKTNARSKVFWRFDSDDEARLVARMAPDLTERDFMELPRFEVYANIRHRQESSGWFSARTLPLGTPISTAEDLRARSRTRYGPPRSSLTSPASPVIVVPPTAAQTDGMRAEDLPGRKRRQP